jgi:hypothetical protein
MKMLGLVKLSLLVISLMGMCAGESTAPDREIADVKIQQ